MAEEEKEDPQFPAFPFEPYKIQVEFMKALYAALNKGGVAMLESPTGTGKTLSIICSALQWVIDRKQREASSNQNQAAEDQSAANDDEPDWMRDFVVEKKKNRDPGTKKKETVKVGFENRKVLGLCKEKVQTEDRKAKDAAAAMDMSEEDEFLVEEYESEEEGIRVGKLKRRKEGDSDLCSSSSEEDDDGDDEKEEDFKVYFCSRTHSQLSQFLKELRRTVFASEINVVCLGSRKNLCINKEVLRLENSARINERCLELQRSRKQDVSKIKVLGNGRRIRQTKASSGCPMLRKQKLQKQFRKEMSQNGALDIEDLVQLGSKIGTCPYYGSRSMVPEADLVILPYQSLLFKSARESLSLNLKNSIVIIDEAHNLADSLSSMYDAKLSLSQLQEVHKILKLYLERFKNLLGAGNRRYIQTLIVLTKAFLRMLLGGEDARSLNPCEEANRSSAERTASVSSMSINDFLFSLDIDNMNLVKLKHYMKESNIIHKVSGYGARSISLEKGPMLDDGEKRASGSIISGFQSLSNILLSLTNNDGDGRIILSRRTKQQEEGYLKYVMLAGDKIFSEIMEQAHAVVLAGGTLQPIEETRERLFPWLCSDRFHFFSCSHIVPPESILPIAVPFGPSGMSFDFSYSSRHSSSMIEELGRLLCNLGAVVPEGIVVFFPSFEYERQVFDAWLCSGILARIKKKKLVLREPRSNADVEVVLREYKEAITKLSCWDSKEGPALHTGAILLAVVGGKLSEGINFSDGMGRCVVMVGLPYPSPSDIEMMERIKYIDGLGEPIATRTSNPQVCNESHNGDTVQAGFDVLRNCKRRGKEYYENLCMKAVNQSIGRAIRHINDYAAILLVDSRYSSNRSVGGFSHPSSKLPHWIKDQLVSATKNYGEVHRMIHQFFLLNKQKRNA